MKLPRRQFLHLAAGAGVPPAVSRIATAQTYPMRAMPYSAGGPPERCINGKGPLQASEFPMLVVRCEQTIPVNVPDSRGCEAMTKDASD